MNKTYQNTTKVYDTLGKKYLSDSEKAIPPERKDFIKNIPAGAKILDVGCGGGRDAKEFVKNGFRVTGIDLSGVLIKIAQGEVSEATFKKMSVLDIKFPKESYDAIWAHAVLLHLVREDVIKALSGLHKILKLGGLLHVRVKKGKGEALVKEKISGWQERFYTYFSKKEVESMFKKVGFKIVRSKIMKDELQRPGVQWVSIWGRR